VVHLTGQDVEYFNLKKRNAEWMQEVSAKLERVNTLIKRRELASV
jgi:hypothetical protein